MLKRAVVGLGVVAGMVSVAGAASADPVCGSTAAGWNVPNGSAAFTQTEGPIKSVVNAIGEYRSHSMLSNGPGFYVTHATSITPPANPSRGFLGSECNAPIDQNFLYNSTPGLEQVQNGAIYTFLYKGGTNNFLAYQNGKPGGVDLGTTVANFSWSGGSQGIGFNWVTSTADSGQGYYGVTYNGTRVHYGWFQYMNTQGTASGTPGVNTGVVCSSSLAMWQHDALSGTAGYTGDVRSRTYPSATISGAASSLYNAVYNECYSTNGWFASFGSFLQSLGTSALCFDGNLCDEAADQMVNCFAANNCGSSDHGIWTGVVGSQSSVAISPDDASCWNGNGTGAPCSGSGSSIWGYDVNQTVQWNSGGTQYSCWD